MTPDAPPSTPDPRRFLLSRRPQTASQQQQQQQQDTPRPRQFQQQRHHHSHGSDTTTGNPGSSSSQRFQTTPRFFAPFSSSSAAAYNSNNNTPRPPSSSTQGFLVPPTSARRRRLDDPIHDDALSSPPATDTDDGPDALASPATAARRVRDIHESIELESDVEASSEAGSRSVVGDSAGEDKGDEQQQEGQGDHGADGGPTPKRQRVTVSPDIGWESGCDDKGDDATAGGVGARAADDEVLSNVPGTPTIEEDPDDDDAMDLSDHETGRNPAAPQHQQRQNKQQPTFRPAPRFKLSETESALRPEEGLPEAFSPQRRGARYVPGGLAAEMQSWLAEVRGWGGSGPGHEAPAGAGAGAGAVFRVMVDEVRPGSRMYLVRGRRVGVAGDESAESAKPRDARLGEDDDDTRASVKLMLAGEGKLTGLARRADVHVGCVVMVSQPVWEVALEGEGRWIVACEWLSQGPNVT